LIIGLIGCFEEFWQINPLGNGKTMAMTWFGYEDYLEGRKVLSNYKTSFTEMATVENMVEMFNTTDLQDITFLIDEIHVVFDSLGHKQNKTRLITNMITQTRKRNVDLYFTTQRWKNVHTRLRSMTAYVLQPIKVHPESGRVCNQDSCKAEHEIIITCVLPRKPWPLKILNCEAVGGLYNSNQIITEKY
jgi:hypothetical protein